MVQRSKWSFFYSRALLLRLVKSLELDILEVVAAFRDQLVMGTRFADGAFFDKVTALRKNEAWLVDIITQWKSITTHIISAF